MNYEQLQSVVIDAVTHFMGNDRYLLEEAVREESISHRLAVYIEPAVTGFNVDCEYDANADDESRHKKVIRRRCDGESDARPDIIVHHRGKNGSKHNQLVVEVKKSPSTQSELENDFDKLAGFTAPQPVGIFNYVCGALLHFGVREATGAVKIEWFKAGDLTDSLVLDFE